MAKAATSRPPAAAAPAVNRAFQILDYLASTRRESSLTEIAKVLELNKSTCYNILQTMMTLGAVVRDPRYPVYRLGPKLVELGTASRRNFNHREGLKQLIRPLVEELGLTCIIAQPLPEHRGVVVIDRLVPPNHPSVLTAPIGHVYPLSAPAIGRAVLANDDLDELTEPADIGLRTKTEFTRFLRSVEQARRAGYGVSREEANEGVNAVAAVLRDTDGHTAFVLSLVGNADRFPPDSVDEVGVRLRDLAATAAVELSSSSGPVASFS